MFLVSGRSVLPIKAATYYSRAAILHDPELASDRAKSDVIDCADIDRVFEASGKRYGGLLRLSAKPYAKDLGHVFHSLSDFRLDRRIYIE